MTDSVLWLLLIATVSRAVPLALAAMGGFTSERAGVINIGLEGKMLMGALATALGSAATGSALAGLACAVAAGVLMAWLHWLATQIYRIDHVVSGMAINAIALGASDFLAKWFQEKRPEASATLMPVGLYIAMAIAVPLALAVYTTRSRLGLRLLAVGSDPDKARTMGVSPIAIRFKGLTATGVLCGLAGAMIVTNEAGQFSNAMTAGRGFIALAALILGGWRPIPTALACAAFGFLEALRIRMQGDTFFGLSLPNDFWLALPYLATLIALAGFLGRGRAPAGLGKP